MYVGMYVYHGVRACARARVRVCVWRACVRACVRVCVCWYPCVTVYVRVCDIRCNTMASQTVV